MEQNLIFIVLFLYGITAALFGFNLWPGVRKTTLITGWLTHTGSLLLRSIEAGRLPFANLYEFTSLFSWGIILAYFITGKKIKSSLIGAVLVGIAAAALAYALTMPSEIRPLMAALQSSWLKFHVLVAVLAYGSFAISFAIAVVYLISSRKSVNRDKHTMEKLIYQSIAFGFTFQTLVLITGAVWAEQAWGTWWSWDPKEIWALITWFIYAGFLHARHTRNWGGKKAAWTSILGFAAVLFTLFGVSLLLPGQHSYK
ncbi:MAG: cytochrome c biogenesis protein CcsA [Bacillota bacterium]